METVPLLGSSILPPMVDIGPRSVQVGEVIRRAMVDRDLSPTAWNALPELEREWWMLVAIHTLRVEANLLVYNA